MTTESTNIKNKGGRPKPNKDECRQAASKYRYKSEFRAAEPRMYSKAYIQHWLDEFFPEKKARTQKYTLDECKRLASVCCSRREFRLNNPTAYARACKNGWLDNLGLPDRKSTNMNAHRLVSDAEVIATAKKCTTSSEFRHKYKRFYNIANKRKMLMSFTWLDKNPEIMNGFYDNVYVYEFPNDRVAYVGRTVNPQLRDAEHRKPGDVVCDYADKAGISVPFPKYVYSKITLDDGRAKECEVMDTYRSDGWKLLNRQVGGGIGNLRRISKKKLMTIAHKYEYRSDFRCGDSAAYNALAKYGWLRECTWLKQKHSGPRPGISRKDYVSKWADYNVCKTEAMKYKSRNEFRVGSCGAFEYAWKQGWVQEWFPKKLNDPRPVGKYDRITGEQLCVYLSVADAANDAGVCNEAVRSVCLGKNKTCHGYVYKYME